MSILKQSIEIPDFIEKIQVSEKRRAKYYTQNACPVRMSPSKNEKYSFNEEGILLCEGAKVVANPTTVGTPRFWKISGQDFWSGMNYNMRSKISKEMKKYFYQFLSELTPWMEDKYYPIGIKIDLYDSNLEGDLDNFIYIYRKTITDALCGHVEFMKVKDVDGKIRNIPDYGKYPPIIIDDSKHYVRDIPTKFHLTENERKLVIELYMLNEIQDG